MTVILPVLTGDEVCARFGDPNQTKDLKNPGSEE